MMLNMALLIAAPLAVIISITPAMAQAGTSGAADLLASIAPFVLIGAAVWFFARRGKQERLGTSPIPKNARTSLLFGDVTLVNDQNAARNQISKLIEENKSKSKEYEWQYKDSNYKDKSKNDLSFLFKEIARLLHLKKENITLTDMQLRALNRDNELNFHFKDKSLSDIDNFSALGYRYLEQHPATKFFCQHLLDDHEIRSLKNDAKKSLSSSLIEHAWNIVKKARQAIPSNNNIPVVEQGLNEIGLNGNYANFTRQTALNELSASLRQAELKALSENRATVTVRDRTASSRESQKFRNAQEAVEGVRRGMLILSGSEIVCRVSDVYGNDTVIFTASTNYNNDFSGFTFHTAWRPL